jgi:hypothetical protein
MAFGKAGVDTPVDHIDEESETVGEKPSKAWGRFL